MPGIRSRGGCWSCRQKRRKCDEAKPSCETCKTRGIVCGGYEMRFTEFRAQGNYSGQLVCKLARGSAPENGPPKSTRRRGPAATRRTSTTRQLSPPPPPPKPPPQPSVPAPDNASTQSAPANQSQDSVCSLPAGTADEVLPDRPPAVFGPTPPPLQGTETGPEEPQGCQNCRRLSSTAASQINVSPARSILAASYSPVTSQNDMATHRPSGSDSDRQDQDWGILEPADALGLDAHLGFGTQDDGIWHLMQSDLDAPIGLGTPASPRQDVGLLELAEISNNDHQHVEQGVGQDMHEFSTDSMEGLDDLPRHQVDPGPQTAGILSREAMVLLDIDSSAASTFRSHDGLGLSSFSTSIQDITSYSDFSSPFDTYLFSHFFSVLAPGFYPVAPHHNPFKLVYGKLASICPPLRATILGASALHLGGMSQLPPGVVSLYRDASRVSFSTAVKSRRRTEALAATILLSIIADSIGSGTACWTSKLGLVRSLLQDKAVTPPSPDSAIVMSFLHLHFSWMTAIARTVKWHDSSLADADTLEFIEDPLHESLFSRDHAKWFCNLPDYRFFCLLKEATRLHRMVLDPFSDNEGIRSLIPDVADLLYRVKEWQPGPSTATAPYSAFVAEVNEIWRQGLLSYIYDDICSLPPSDRRMRACVGQGMTALRSLSWLQSIIWPLFMIGVHAIDANDRQFLQTACNTMSISINFGSPLTMINIFRQVWADMDLEGTDKCRWRTVMMQTGIEINLVI